MPLLARAFRMVFGSCRTLIGRLLASATAQTDTPAAVTTLMPQKLGFTHGNRRR